MKKGLRTKPNAFSANQLQPIIIEASLTPSHLLARGRALAPGVRGFARARSRASD
jgi:hypothetical protein